MYYIKWLGSEYDLELDDVYMDYLYTEINNNGQILREIGFDKNGKIIHKCPSNKFKYGTYGFFDLNIIETKELKNDLTKDEFEKLWISDE